MTPTIDPTIALMAVDLLAEDREVSDTAVYMWLTDVWDGGYRFAFDTTGDH